MNFFDLLLLSLFISVNSLTATEDGTFHENAKRNGENLHLPKLKDQAKALYSVNIVTNVRSRTKLNDGENCFFFTISLDLFHTV